MTNCRYCDAVTSNFVYDVCDNCSGYANFAKQKRAAQANGFTDSMKMSTLSEYIAKIERDILDSAAVPSFVLMGTPSASGMYFDGQPLWRNEFMGQWNVSGTALEAEERRQRRDDHVEALKYAMTGRTCGKYAEAMEGGCDKPSGHDGFCSGPAKGYRDIREVIYGHDRGMPIYDFPCSCGRTIRGTDRDRGKRCEHAEEPGIWCAANGTWACARTDSHIRAMCHDGRANGIPKWISDAHPSPFGPVQPAEPKPPTLREWLGPRASELGPWAEVLREQPVPAGKVNAWTWKQDGDGYWFLASDLPLHELPPVILSDLLWCVSGCGPLAKFFQKVFFHRHPAVKPEPPPMRTWFGNEEEV